jgi:DNA-binding SARP family transcriptional activator/tetratricopeptide (TPR) repeat protein
LRFRALGPLRVRVGDRWSGIGAAHQRSLLAILLIEAGRAVPTDRLVQEIWGDRPPKTAVHAVHVYVRRLRGLLGDEILATRGQAYELTRVDTDAIAFEQLVSAARHSPDPQTVVSQLSQALALWRGPAFADVPDSPRVLAEATRLDQARLTAVEDKLEAMLELGHAAEVIDECRVLTPQYPLREKLHAHLMLALHRSGRRAEALEAYQLARKALVDELGLEPGPLLRLRHRAILIDDEPLEPAPRVVLPPRQLPQDVAGFTGRREQLRELDELPPDARVVAITGGPGVGKSALAVHWAHRVRDGFPDGQLHINLRGYAAGSPVRPVDAIAGFLRALGTAPERIPSDVDEAAALYRSQLSGKRMLILLDNANHPDQVRPLLPGEASCFVLVTSRDRLDGLVARDGAERLPLDPLTPPESEALLTRLLGKHRVGAEPVATTHLTRLCGHLPLALRIAAAQLSSGPAQLSGRPAQPPGGVPLGERNSIAELAGHLSHPDRLAVLEVEGDPAAGVRPAFDHSYRALGTQAQRVFRLCGAVSGPDLAPRSVAVLAAIPQGQAESLLSELRAAHLVDESTPERFALHDLLRLYAAEQLSDEESGAALGRLYDFYLGSVDSANRVLYPHILRPPQGEGTTAGLQFEDHQEALRWLEDERANLVAAVLHSPPAVAWRLADSLRSFLHLTMSYLDWQRVAVAGLEAALAGSSALGQATAELGLGLWNLVQDQHALTVKHCSRALILARKAGWPEGEASALNHLAAVYWSAGRLPAAMRRLRQSVEIDRRLGQPASEAVKLANLGLIHAALGQLEAARAHLAGALEFDVTDGSVGSEARTLANLAEAHHLLGDFDTARAMLERALNLHEQVGDRSGWATTTRALADVHRDTGGHAEALDAAKTALAVARETGNQRLEAYTLSSLGRVWSRIGKHRKAIEHYRRALELAGAIGERYLKTEVLIGLAGTGDEAAAQQALDLARRHGYRVLEGNALLAQAEIQLGAGSLEPAAEAAGQALAIHAETGHRPGHTRAADLLARCRARAKVYLEPSASA